jgi:hypothetical protein
MNNLKLYQAFETFCRALKFPSNLKLVFLDEKYLIFDIHVFIDRCRKMIYAL